MFSERSKECDDVSVFNHFLEQIPISSTLKMVTG